jgi:hypothetical protein
MLKKRSSNKKSYCIFIWLSYLIDLEFFVLKIGYIMNDNSIDYSLFIAGSCVYHYNFNSTVRIIANSLQRAWLMNIQGIKYGRRKVSIIKIVIKMSPWLEIGYHGFAPTMLK